MQCLCNLCCTSAQKHTQWVQHWPKSLTLKRNGLGYNLGNLGAVFQKCEQRLDYG